MSDPYIHFSDSDLFELVARELGVSTYNLLKYAMLQCDNQVFQNHLDCAFESLIIGHPLPSRYREYTIKVLTGREVYISDDTEKEQALLLA